MKKYLMISLSILLVFFIVGCSSKVDPGTTGAVTTSLTAGETKIPVSEVSETIKKYTYNAKGVQVTYFAVKGSDGKTRVAFDACDVCGGKKGYTQVESDIKCNNCGRVFKIDGLGTQNKGYGCWPSYLPHEVKNNEIIIKKSDLETGAHRFV